jgi:hypothetical protein
MFCLNYQECGMRIPGHTRRSIYGQQLVYGLDVNRSYIHGCRSIYVGAKKPIHCVRHDTWLPGVT